ncbi:MAG: hypothetical protein Q8O55_03330 [Dehalococcoidales bacterium]|nr:hypothetical protein [Dehalococcoidales bacterium]
MPSRRINRGKPQAPIIAATNQKNHSVLDTESRQGKSAGFRLEFIPYLIRGRNDSSSILEVTPYAKSNQRLIWQKLAFTEIEISTSSSG